MLNYLDNHPELIFFIIVCVFILFFLVSFIISCKKTSDTIEEIDPDKIDDIYIFRDQFGYLIINDEKDDLAKFTFIQAKDFAKDNPAFEVKLYNPIVEHNDWQVAETYFCL